MTEYSRLSTRHAPGPLQPYNAYARETVTISGSITDQDLRETSTLFDKLSSAGYVSISGAASLEFKLNDDGNDTLEANTTAELSGFYIENIYVTNAGSETSAEIILYGWK
jgi:hypothetical protein